MDPGLGRARIESMVANRPDWCISRQRTWGVPMSLFVHKETQELHPNTPELMEEVAKRVEVNGIQAWWDLDARDIWARTRTTTRKCQIPRTCGSTLVRPTPRWLTCVQSLPVTLPTCIWKGLTNTAAGSCHP